MFRKAHIMGWLLVLALLHAPVPSFADHAGGDAESDEKSDQDSNDSKDSKDPNAEAKKEKEERDKNIQSILDGMKDLDGAAKDKLKAALNALLDPNGSLEG